MARLLIYDAYENKVYTYNSLNENDPMPYSTGTTLRVREFRGKSGQPGALDDHRGHGGLEPDPPQVRQRHSGGVCLPPHLGGRPRHPQPALRGRGL